EGRAPGMPGGGRATETALSTLASTSRPATGTTWMVTSRAMSDSHSPAALLTSTAAPVVSDARKVMMATTATSARPEIELRGTRGVSKRGNGSTGARADAVPFRAPISAMRPLSRKYAAGHRAERVAAHRTDPGAGWRGWQ